MDREQAEADLDSHDRRWIFELTRWNGMLWHYSKEDTYRWSDRHRKTTTASITTSTPSKSDSK